MATIKEIADLAGVSRGTVDRVLNNRPGVNSQTAEKVREIAKNLNYRPNKAGIALAAQKKKYKIGVVLFSKDNPFFDEVSQGAEAKAIELEDYGITTITKRVDFDAGSQLEAIDALVEEGVNGLMLAPFNDTSIQEKINDLVDAGIPVVTVNTDISGSKRMAYVGSDYYKGGAIVAGLLGLMSEGDIKLGVITGSNHVLCHSERIRGLSETIASTYRNIHIVDIKENHDDENRSYSLTKDMLRQHPDLNAVFFVAAGVLGGCRAILESGRSLKVITFDDVPTTIEMLQAGVISATISQLPYKQGSKSLDILFEYLTSSSEPDSELNFVEHSIKIRENL